jgi:SAM-dependent methyltransferase
MAHSFRSSHVRRPPKHHSVDFFGKHLTQSAQKLEVVTDALLRRRLSGKVLKLRGWGRQSTLDSNYCKLSAPYFNLVTFFHSTAMKPENLVDKSKIRWRGTELDEGLTWGTIWDGSAFLNATRKRASFTPSTSILEIGPGYGRILDQILNEGLPFQSYLGLDLSQGRVDRLTEKYKGNERIKFLLGDVETFQLDQRFDLCISSATFPHFYPDCGVALRNVAAHLKPGGLIAFDLASKPEPSDGPYGSWEGHTYACAYAPSDIKRLVAGTRFSDLTTEHILHGKAINGEDVILLFVMMAVR